MRTILTLFHVTATALMVNAQSGWYAVVPGDSVKLIVTGHNGAIQWQQSTDSLT